MKKKPVTALAKWLVRLTGPDRARGANHRLNEDIRSLDNTNPDAVKNYYVKKTRDLLLLFFTLFPAAILLFLLSARGAAPAAVRSLTRPLPGESSVHQDLTVTTDGRGKETIGLDIAPRLYTEAEAEALLEEAWKEADRLLPGENPSVMEIRSDICMPSSFQQGAVLAQWTSFPYGVIDDQGGIVSVPEEEEGCLVELQAILSCAADTGTRTMQYACAVRVLPPLLSDEEGFWRHVRHLLKTADEDSRSLESILLPRQLQGEALRWQTAASSSFATVFLLFPAILLFVYARRDQQIRELAQERREQLQMDYSLLLWQLALLLGAGLTIRTAFFRIGRQYQDSRKTGQKKRYVFEEVLTACRDMDNGTPEGSAYERFGRRCGLPCYIKLGTVLSQQLHKGSGGLARQLEQEARQALEERKSAAKKAGERAGTKLLLPMIAMLGVVLAILMAPTLMSL